MTHVSTAEEPSPILSLTPATLLWRGQKLVNFASHDYLGLSQHPAVRKSAIKCLLQQGAGISFSELNHGYVEVQREVEEKCAKELGFPHLSFVSSRIAAYAHILHRLTQEMRLILIDELLLQELKTILPAIPAHTPFRHNDLDHLEFLLKSAPTRQKAIVSATLFGLSGSVSHVSGLSSLSQAFNSPVILDDTYAFSVHGDKGLGYAQSKEGIDTVLSALDRGAGLFGAYIASQEALRTHNTHQAREIAAPFALLGAAEEVFAQVRLHEGERMQLKQRSYWLYQQLSGAGVTIHSSPSSHIFCVEMKQNKPLLPQGFLCEVEEPPQLRFVLNAQHTPQELTALIDALAVIEA